MLLLQRTLDRARVHGATEIRSANIAEFVQKWFWVRFFISQAPVPEFNYAQKSVRWSPSSARTSPHRFDIQFHVVLQKICTRGRRRLEHDVAIYTSTATAKVVVVLLSRSSVIKEKVKTYLSLVA